MSALLIDKLENDHLGPIWVAVTAQGLAAVSLWPDGERFAAEVAGAFRQAEAPARPELLREALEQIAGYLRRERREFTLPLDWSAMTPFQRRALELVVQIPYGGKATYQDIADRLGKPGAARAVGRANATNPIPIVIPCHRVLGADGSLHGYSAPGGLETKAWLLQLEGSWLI